MFTKIDWNNLTVVELVTLIVLVIVAIVGAAVVVFGPDGALSFEDYLNDMVKFLGATGVISVGAGLANAKFGGTTTIRNELAPPPKT